MKGRIDHFELLVYLKTLFVFVGVFFHTSHTVIDIMSLMTHILRKCLPSKISFDLICLIHTPQLIWQHMCCRSTTRTNEWMNERDMDQSKNKASGWLHKKSPSGGTYVGSLRHQSRYLFYSTSTFCLSWRRSEAANDEIVILHLQNFQQPPKHTNVARTWDSAKKRLARMEETGERTFHACFLDD